MPFAKESDDALVEFSQNNNGSNRFNLKYTQFYYVMTSTLNNVVYSDSCKVSMFDLRGVGTWAIHPKIGILLKPITTILAKNYEKTYLQANLTPLAL